MVEKMGRSKYLRALSDVMKYVVIEIRLMEPLRKKKFRRCEKEKIYKARNCIGCIQPYLSIKASIINTCRAMTLLHTSSHRLGV